LPADYQFVFYNALDSTLLLIKLAQPVARETGNPLSIGKTAGKNQIGPDRNFTAGQQRDLPLVAGMP
jgi:hypothetical protein